jgi:hypothetical protein
MFGLGKLVFGMMVGAGLMFASYNYQVVRTPDRLLVVARIAPHLKDLYVDTRDWGIQEWQARPVLTKSMRKNGYGDVIEQSMADGLLGGLAPETSRVVPSSLTSAPAFR